MKSFGNRPIATGLVSIGSILFAIAFAACFSPQEKFQGTTLTPASPATPFELTNQFGQMVSLSDYEGQVVLLTFLYTNCPDVCPIVTSQLRNAHEMLGDVADEVAFVAISVDPERDSVEAVHAFSDKWDMTDKWAFLVGDKEELSPLWKAYYLDPIIDDRTREDGEDHSEDVRVQTARRGGVSALRQDIKDRYLVIHSSPVFLIDREGVMRVVVTPPLDIDALVHDIKLLVN